jgi:hypothetical protein
MLQNDDLIRERAHQIWERETRPDGRASAHWEMASAEIEAENGPATSTIFEGDAQTARPSNGAATGDSVERSEFLDAGNQTPDTALTPSTSSARRPRRRSVAAITG